MKKKIMVGGRERKEILGSGTEKSSESSTKTRVLVGVATVREIAPVVDAVSVYGCAAGGHGDSHDRCQVQKRKGATRVSFANASFTIASSTCRSDPADSFLSGCARES